MTKLPPFPGPRTFAGYIARIQVYIYVVVGLWAFSTVLGAVFALTMPAETAKLIELIAAQLGGFKDLSTWDLAIGIFLNNVRACLIEILAGLVFGIVTVLVVFENGIAIGMVGATVVQKAGLIYLVAGFAPHGIIELPMVALSAAIGLRFGHCVLKAILKQPVNLLRELYDGLAVYVVWVIPLLLVAAFIEAYVTTALLKLLGA